MTYKIRIDDTVKIHNVSYQLFGLVISKGKLGSGKTYSIVRSSHIGSQWARYKSGTVTYQTRRQAVEYHEGQGLTREGQDSVVQVLIYVREDALCKVLPSKVVETQTPTMSPVTKQSALLHSSIQPGAATVCFHYAEEFDKYEGLGILSPDSFRHKNTTDFHCDSTIEDIAKFINRNTAGKEFIGPSTCSNVQWTLPPAYSPPRIVRSGPSRLGRIAGFPDIHVLVRMIDEVSGQELMPYKKPVPSDDKARSCKHPCKEVFIKRFDPRKSSPIKGMANFLAPYDQTLGQALAKVVAGFKPRKRIVYIEQTSGFEIRRTEIKLDTKIGDPEIPDGGILILVPAVDQDRFGDVNEYYQSLRNRQNWAYRGEHYRRAYFGGQYLDAELQNGHITGKGIKIAPNGDFYSGTFHNGLIHGKGDMYYSSHADFYTGSWSAGQRSGHGEMRYGKTGNVYVGEWREDRRYGAGHMTYKMADEQLQQCHICYTNDIDALFFRCGHILACESCAKQCRECPICRKPVDAVVKIFDMRKIGV